MTTLDAALTRVSQLVATLPAQPFVNSAFLTTAHGDALDVPQAISTLRYYAEAIDKVYGEVGPSPA